MKTPGTLYTVSAPSGAGKTSLVNALADKSTTVRVSVSHTSRPMRPGEQDGVNYHFVTETAFQEMASRGVFLEQALVFGNHYGTSQEWVEQQLAAGEDVVLEIDWQGAEQIRRLRPDSISIFILPPSRAALLERLQSRGQDGTGVIEKRMQQAASEISHYSEADFIVVNDVFDSALEAMESILISQRLSSEKQIVRQQTLITELLS